MYSDIIDAFDEFAVPLKKLTDLYEGARATLDGAVMVDSDSGAVRVDRDALRYGFEQLAPPLDPEQFESIAAGLELGFLVRDNTLFGPASMLLDSRLTEHLDVNAWRSFGIRPDRKVDTVSGDLSELFPNVPGVVLEPGNVERLVSQASAERKRVRSYERYSGLPSNSLQQRNGGPKEPPIKGGATPHQTRGGVIPGVDTRAPWDPVWDSVVKAADCLVNADWTMQWYGPQICLDRRCADAIQSILVGSNAESFVVAFLQLTMKVFENVIAGSWAGWVGAGIASGEFYWGLMIAANKTSQGVCLIIPGPWTFGLMGPGWAVGRR